MPRTRKRPRNLGASDFRVDLDDAEEEEQKHEHKDEHKAGAAGADGAVKR